jgi:hypothetical protein
LSGKSSSYLTKLVSLLRLPKEVIDALKCDALGVTQGIVFSENLNSSRFNDILSQALANKMTVKAITAAFKKGKTKNTGVAFFKKRITQLSNDVQKNASHISPGFAQELLRKAQELVKQLESMVQGD